MIENDGTDWGVDEADNIREYWELDEKLDFERMYNGEWEKFAFNLSTSV